MLLNETQSLFPDGYDNNPTEVFSRTRVKQQLWNPLDDDSEEDLDDINFDLEVEEVQGFEQDIGQLADTYKSYHTSDCLECEDDLPTTSVAGREVGDDRVDFSSSVYRLLLGLYFQETVVLMKTSREDTFVSPFVWNFCESTQKLPYSKEVLFQSASKSGSKTDRIKVGFVDTPPLRVVLDVKKDNQQHSDSLIGKISLLAKKMSNCRKDNLTMLQIAQFVQLTYLDAQNSKYPVPIPVTLGGLGAETVFGNTVNDYLQCVMHKNAQYTRIHATAIAEAQDYVQRLKGNEQMATDRIDYPVSRQLRSDVSTMYGTYENLLFIPSQQSMRSLMEIRQVSGNKFPKPLYTGGGISKWLLAMENRLFRSNLACTGRVAIAKFNESVKLIGYITSPLIVKQQQDIEKITAIKKRAAFEYTRSNVSALDLLIRREANDATRDELLIDKTFDYSKFGKLGISLSQILWLRDPENRIYLSIFNPGEEVFATDELESHTVNLRVGGIPLRPKESRRPVTYTTSKTGMYLTSETDLQQLQQVIAGLKHYREFVFHEIGRSPVTPLTTAVRGYMRNFDDDLFILEDIRERFKKTESTVRLSEQSATSSIAIITNDKALCETACQNTEGQIIRIDPLVYFRWYHEREQQNEIVVSENVPRKQDVQDFVDERTPHGIRRIVCQVYLDTGNVQGVFQSLTATTKPGRYIQKEFLRSQARGQNVYNNYRYTVVNDLMRLGGIHIHVSKKGSAMKSKAFKPYYPKKQGSVRIYNKPASFKQQKAKVSSEKLFVTTNKFKYLFDQNQ